MEEPKPTAWNEVRDAKHWEHYADEAFAWT